MNKITVTINFFFFFVKDTANAHLKHYMHDHFMLC